MKKYFSILSIIFLIAIPVLHAQQFIPDRKTDIIICGFDQAISGESIPYFSCYEDYATDALLTRCTDGNKTIE